MSINGFNHYQMLAKGFRLPTADTMYLVLGLAEETGEVMGKIAKQRRDGTPIADMKVAVAKELGDVLFMVAGIAEDLGYDLASIADMNVEKLRSRQDRNKLTGSGDDR